MTRLLLHVCCAPDASVPWPSLLLEGYDAEGFFYGSNIHPYDEYLKRLEAVETLSRVTGKKIFVQEYDAALWLDVASVYSGEPEGGARCRICFALQFEAAARCAVAESFTHISTTLTISPHKDVAFINSLGKEIANRHGLVWMDRVWRKNNGFKISVEKSKELGLYRQSYCGCVYSMRTNGE